MQFPPSLIFMPLKCAVRNGKHLHEDDSLAVVKLLLDRGADINAIDNLKRESSL